MLPLSEWLPLAGFGLIWLFSLIYGGYLGLQHGKKPRPRFDGGFRLRRTVDGEIFDTMIDEIVCKAYGTGSLHPVHYLMKTKAGHYWYLRKDCESNVIYEELYFLDDNEVAYYESEIKRILRGKPQDLPAINAGLYNHDKF